MGKTIYKPIVIGGEETNYKISKQGVIVNTKLDHEMKITETSFGRFVTLSIGKSRKKYDVDELVAEAFKVEEEVKEEKKEAPVCDLIPEAKKEEVKEEVKEEKPEIPVDPSPEVKEEDKVEEKLSFWGKIGKFFKNLFK